MSQATINPQHFRKHSANIISIMMFALTTILLFANVHSRAYSANDSSRMAAIESLVHRGTWQIDDSPFLATTDKVFLNDHFYSDKPPTLTYFAALAYHILYTQFGLELQATGCEPLLMADQCQLFRTAEPDDLAYVILTLIFVIIPAAIIATLSYRLALHFKLPALVRYFTPIFLIFGTAMLPYSTVFNNHIPAAAALFVAFYIYLVTDKLTMRSVAAIGFLLSLSASFDLSAIFFGLSLLLLLALADRMYLLAALLGASIPALLTIILDYQMIGRLLPPQFYSEGYSFAGSVLEPNVAGFAWGNEPLQHLFDLLVGSNGLFFFFPISIWFVATYFWKPANRGSKERILLGGLATAAIANVLFFLIATDNFGGFAFSTRWLLIPVTFLSLGAIIQPDLYRTRWRLAVFILLGASSIVGASRGLISPWHPAYPLVRLEIGQFAPVDYRAATISGYDSFASIPAELTTGFGKDIVVRRWYDASNSVVIPQGETWWFLGPAANLNPYLASRLNLPTTAPFSFKADLTLPTLNFINGLDQTVTAISPVDQTRMALKMPLTFAQEANAITLLGYEIIEGEIIFVNTAWQIAARQFPTGERRMFLHLLNGEEEIVAQSDYFGASYPSLQVGDIVVQQQAIDIGGLPAGQYRLQMGLYDPATNLRLTTNSVQILRLADINLE